MPLTRELLLILNRDGKMRRIGTNNDFLNHKLIIKGKDGVVGVDTWSCPQVSMQHVDE